MPSPILKKIHLAKRLPYGRKTDGWLTMQATRGYCLKIEFDK
jgi:hypothetical protein